MCIGRYLLVFVIVICGRRFGDKINCFKRKLFLVGNIKVTSFFLEISFFDFESRRCVFLFESKSSF